MLMVHEEYIDENYFTSAIELLCNGEELNCNTLSAFYCIRRSTLNL